MATIKCTRCEQKTESLERPPFGNALGKRIFETICAGCWKEWEGMEIKVINEYRLSFLDPEHRTMLQKTCLDFLKLA